MSPLPNSKSSCLRTAQNCGALLLAGAMALPLVPAQAQTGSPAAESASTTDSASATGSASITGSLPVDSMPRPGIDQNVDQAPTFTVEQSGDQEVLYTSEGGTLHVKGTGYTKKWREQHGSVSIYITASEGAPSANKPMKDVLLRFEEGKDFTIAEDGSFDAQLTVKKGALLNYYEPDTYFPGVLRYEVRYEADVVATPKGEDQPTVESLWAKKNVVQSQRLNTRAYRSEPFAPSWRYSALTDTAKKQVLSIHGYGFNGEIHSVKGIQYVVREKGSNTPVLAVSDIIEFNHHDYSSEYENGEVLGEVEIPAGALDASKQYVLEAWANDGYSESGELLAPVVGKPTEGRGTLLAWQNLNLKGVDTPEQANLPKDNNDKKPTPKPAPEPDQDQHKPAPRGELAAALYVQVGAPEMKLPKTSPWPDVKTDDPNFPAYIWAKEKGVTSGWSDGKFHADAGISNATVTAFTYRAAGSPAVKGNSMYKDVTPGSAFYREIVWAGQNKVSLNTGDSFEPRHMVTRGELVTLVLAFQHRGK